MHDTVEVNPIGYNEVAMKRHNVDSSKTKQFIEKLVPMMPLFENRLKQLEAPEGNDANKERISMYRRIIAYFPRLQNLQAKETSLKNQIETLENVYNIQQFLKENLKKNATNSPKINHDSSDSGELNYLTKIASSLVEIVEHSVVVGKGSLTPPVLNEPLQSVKNKPSQNGTDEDGKKDAALKKVEQTDGYVVSTETQSSSGREMRIVNESKTTTSVKLDEKTQVAKATFDLKKPMDTQESYAGNGSHSGINEVPRQQLVAPTETQGNAGRTSASSSDGFSQNNTAEIFPLAENPNSQSLTEGIENTACEKFEMEIVVSNTNGHNAAIDEARAPGRETRNETLSPPHNAGDSFTDRQPTPQICTKSWLLLLLKFFCFCKTLAGVSLLAMELTILGIWMLELIGWLVGCQTSLPLCTHWNEKGSFRLIIKNQDGLIADWNWIGANILLVIVFFLCTAGIKYYAWKWSKQLVLYIKSTIGTPAVDLGEEV